MSEILAFLDAFFTRLLPSGWLYSLQGLLIWREGAPANRATRLEGLTPSPPLHATHLTGMVSGQRGLSFANNDARLILREKLNGATT